MLGMNHIGASLLMYLLTILILLLSLAFHELGHYTFAKVFKVNVKEFSIGVGPKIKTWTTKKGMRISLRCIPLIAYVMIDSKKIRDLYKNEKTDKNYKFYTKPVPKYSRLLEDTKL
jgi:membrane-associated protease RseP (regulator of RpoE activity)